MKNKGFTLVELIGVVVIIGLIAVFSVPALTKTIKESAEKEYNEYAKNIELAAENYFHSETDGIINVKEFIQVGTLLENGYLKNQVNPKTNQETSNDATIIVSKNSDGTENYEFVDFNATENGYETDGLIVSYDGYNTPIDGVWKDLSGNGNDGTLMNSVWESNNILIDSNTNSRIFVYDLIPQYSKITMSITMKVNNETNRRSIFNNFDGGGTGFEFHGDKICFLVYLKDIGYKSVCSTEALSINEIYNVSGTYDGKIINLYINGVKNNYLNISGTIAWSSNNTIFAIGCNPTGNVCQTDYSDMNVYSVKLYDRSLSDTEIYNNYQIDRYRFDI